MIEVTGLTMRYGDALAVDDLSFAGSTSRSTGWIPRASAGSAS